MERIEALIILIWIAGVYLKISFSHYLSAVSLQQVFGLKGYRPLLAPLAALIVVLSVFFFENILEMTRFPSNYPGLFLISFLPRVCPCFFICSPWQKRP